MKKIVLELKNFKCFQDLQLGLNDLTVFLGANATGKSSILQSILIYLQAATKANRNNNAQMSLYQDFGYDLGCVENLLCKDAKDQNITISIDEIEAKIDLTKHEKLSDVINVQIRGQDINYSYLCAERIGPRNTVEYHNSPNCGMHGEYTAYIINKENLVDVDKEKFWDNGLEGKFSTQLDNWVQYLFPNMKIQVDCQFNKIAQLKVNSGVNSILATNIGFGLSYSLPVLVEGLRLEKGSWFIVENPEAHLQPKAQTRMGYFLARMAAAGIRVIVETHSEHVLKGMQAVIKLKENGFDDSKVSVYFTEQKEGKSYMKQVALQRDGIAVYKFPRDFFDYDDKNITHDAPNAQRLAEIGKIVQQK